MTEEGKAAAATVIELLAKRGPLTRYGVADFLKDSTNYATSHIYATVDELEAVGIIISKASPWRAGGMRRECYLSFKGLIKYLASYRPPSSPGATIIEKPGETEEDLRLRAEREMGEYQARLEEARQLFKKYGELLNYPLFRECEVFEEITLGGFYHYFTEIAKLLVHRPPIPEDWSRATKAEIERMRELKQRAAHHQRVRERYHLEPMVRFEVREGKEVQTGVIDSAKTLEEEIQGAERIATTMLEVEDRAWREAFALHFFEYLQAYLKDAPVPNQSLYRLAESILQRKRAAFLKDEQMLNAVTNYFKP